MKHPLAVLIISLLARACTDDQKGRPEGIHIDPIEMFIWNSDFSNAYTLQYRLSEKKLTVIFPGGLEVERDSVLYIGDVNYDNAFKSISEIDFARLKEVYTNDCIADGSQITFTSKKNGTSKSVHLSNYYQSEIGQVVRYINAIVPKEYKIVYDSSSLTTMFNECK